MVRKSLKARLTTCSATRKSSKPIWARRPPSIPIPVKTADSSTNETDFRTAEYSGVLWTENPRAAGRQSHRQQGRNYLPDRRKRRGQEHSADRGFRAAVARPGRNPF